MKSNPGMMTTEDLPLQQSSLRWSNRIFILSVVGIAYLTLFPFQLNLASPHAFHGSPFLLGDSTKTFRRDDFFLNVLLFVPFGFGLAAQMAKRGGRRWTSALLALLAGAFASYSVELLQLYIPGRDSGWEDVISNTTGSVVGFLLFALLGSAILEIASRTADLFENWISPLRIALLLAIYFAAWFGGSVLLQSKTWPSNWDPKCFLVVGNDADGQFPWTGQVSLLQIWNRAIPEPAVRGIREQELGKWDNAATAGLLGSYEFTGPPPYPDQKNFLPVIERMPAQRQSANLRVANSDGQSWLRTTIPVENLTEEIKKSGQFTIHIVCTSAAIPDAHGRIVSLSQSSANINFHLRQDGANLALWFRTPLTESGSFLAWTVRGAFEPGKVRDIVATYDGSDAFIYLDGRRVPRRYTLSPGAVLLHKISLVKPTDLDGAAIVYETLVFLPAGLLIGLDAGRWTRQKLSALWMIALGLLLPAILLESLLLEVSGRRLWLGNIAFSLAFGLAGVLLMNADRGHFRNSRS